MTDRPILFKADMVRQLMAGRKAQTRRLLTPRNTLFDGRAWSKLHKAQTWDWQKAWIDAGPSPAGNPGPYLKLPWLAGDADPFEGTVHRIYPKLQPGDRLWVKEALFMPRRSSRLTLLVSEVRIERLQAISDADAIAEGVERHLDEPDWWRSYTSPDNLAPSPVHSFATLWEHIHGAGAWQANPWVAPITFQTVKANIDEMAEALA